MPRTTFKIGAARGFPAASAHAQIDPAWQPWLELLGIADDEANHPAWAATGVLPSLSRPDGAPLVHGATLRIDAARAASLMRRLADAVGIVAALEADACEAIRAAIERDDAVIARLAEKWQLSHDTMTVVAQMAAVPMLGAATRALGADVAHSWQRGYCPVCGAWPALVEMRGIERERRLRCACCSAGWQMPVLRCSFCGESDHRRLGFLQPEGEEQYRRIETCESCHGYLKVVTTLGALPLRELAMQDLLTVPLDLVAQDRGYARPWTPGWAPRVRVVS